MASDAAQGANNDLDAGNFCVSCGGQGCDDCWDSNHAHGPQCPVVGRNYANEPERCLRREGHPGEHMGMGSE